MSASPSSEDNIHYLPSTLPAHLQLYELGILYYCYFSDEKTGPQSDLFNMITALEPRHSNPRDF